MLNRPLKILLLMTATMAFSSLFFFRLDAMGFTGPDEPRYAEVAKEMYLSHDYVTPRLLGKPWFEKPVLYYWCTSLSYAIFGINETAARLPSAIAATLMALSLFFAPRQVLNLQTRLFSSLIFATSLGAISFARAASTDMLLTVTFSLAMLFLFVALPGSTGTPQPLSVVLAGVCLGFSALAKGPVGIVLCAVILLCYFGLTGKWKEIPALRIHRGLLIFLIVAAPWYYLCFRANGWIFIDTFLIRHNLLRFAANEFQHVRPIWFYVPVLLVGMLPWTFFLILPASRIKEIGKRGYWKEHPQLTFLMLWIVIPFAFFTLAQSKLPGYILPVLVPLAILLGKSLPSNALSIAPPPDQQYFKPLLRWAYLLESLFLAGMLFFVNLILKRLRLSIEGISGGMTAVSVLAVMILIYCIFSRRHILLGVIGNIFFVAVIVFMTCSILLPKLDADISTRPAAQAILRHSTHPIVFTFDVPRSVRYGLDFYITPLPTAIEHLNELPLEKVQRPSYLVVPASLNENRMGPEQAITEVIFESSKIKVLGINRPKK